MPNPILSRILVVSILSLSVLWPFGEADARRRCVPTLYNCNCTFAQPCPTVDVLKAIQTSLVVAQEQLLLEAMGVLQPGIDALQAVVPPEAVGLLQRIPAQQLLNATMRGTNPANMLGAVAPLAGLAFGASPLAEQGLALAGQGLQIAQMAANGQIMGAIMSGGNVVGMFSPEAAQTMAMLRQGQAIVGQGLQIAQMAANGQVLGAAMAGANIASGLSPDVAQAIGMIRQGQAIVGQGMQIAQMAANGQVLEAAMTGANIASGLSPDVAQAIGMVRQGQAIVGQGLQIGQMMANGQIFGALPGVARLAVPALGLTGAADALGGVAVIQQGFQVAQGLGALSQQAMALRGASMQQVFLSLPALGAASYASPSIAAHAAAWLPPDAPAPMGGDFASVRQAVVAGYGGREDLVAARRRAEAATASLASDAQAKALQIRHALRRHAEIGPRLEAGIQAARTVGDDWRANAAVQMALAAIDDEIREAEATLLALRSSHAAARWVSQENLRVRTSGEGSPVEGASGTSGRAVDRVLNGRTDRDAYVDTIVRLESRPGDPGFAHPNSTAMGDGQFLRGTWLDYVRANPERFAGMSPEEALARRADPMESRRAIAWYAERNEQALARAGMPVNNTTLGLAHRFGARGATSILRADPSTPIEQALPNGRAVLAANPELRGQTVGDVVDRTARAFGG